jgi:hypothetical protein
MAWTVVLYPLDDISRTLDTSVDQDGRMDVMRHRGATIRSKQATGRTIIGGIIP